MKHINTELTEQIRKLALQGTTTREIAEQLSISNSQAYAILKSLDIEAPWKVRRAKLEATRTTQKAAAAANPAATVIPPSYLVDLYLQGKNLVEIGAHVGLSGERVRQLITSGGFSIKELRERRKQAKAIEAAQAQDAITSWVESHKGCTLGEIEKATGFQADRIADLLTSRLRHLILKDSDDSIPKVSVLRKWSDEQIIFALQQAAKRVTPLTREAYDAMVQDGVIAGPVGSWLVNLFDTWRSACDAAKVQPGEAVRDNYEREFSYGDFEAALIQFIGESDNLSVAAYDRWESHKEGLPSSVLIRVRYGTWRIAWKSVLQTLRLDWN